MRARNGPEDTPNPASKRHNLREKGGPGLATASAVLSFSPMHRETQRRFAVTTSASRFLGFVQVQVGAKVFTLPVQAIDYANDLPKGVESDATRASGGFFAASTGELGIFVDGNASATDIQAQIAKGSNEAVRHLSRLYLN